MRILCGTNFSQASARASTVAAHLAQRTSQALHLVHALDVSAGAEPGGAGNAERLLGMEATRLRDLGAVVQTHVLIGTPERALVDYAREIDAHLIVVGAEPQREPGHWSFHHRLDAIAAHADSAVLVVHDEKPFREWISGERPLRVLLGADASATTDAALSLIERLKQLGPCEITALRLFWPPEEFRRLGLTGVRSYLDIDPVVKETLTRELAERLGDLEIVVEPHLGSYGERLARAGTDAKADLIVVGSHQREGASRFWHGSVSRGVLHASDLSVACVPVSAAKHERRRGVFSSALAATDFSDLGNASIASACAAVMPSGTVHVVHVLPHEGGGDPLSPGDVVVAETNVEERVVRAREQLRALCQQQSSSGRRVLVHLLQSNRPAEALVQVAERLNADLICIGTHGRTGLSSAVLGSVAQAVVAQTKRPVLLTRSTSQ